MIFSFDLGYFNLNGNNITTFYDEESDHHPILQVNTVAPKQRAMSFKTDFVTFIGTKWNAGAGMKARYQDLRDKTIADYFFTENIVAGYGMFNYKNGKIDAGAGIRIENSTSETGNQSGMSFLYWLPNLSLK
ncbi:MAG: outer membrane beta-barrel protein [Bacteroidales bacterium]|nr:outer membrane beta-barrel protein [Bacteroidales bacterium]